MPLNTNCSTAGFNSIQVAVTTAAPGDTVIVCDGVYKETVSIAKSLTLLGSGKSVIDAPSGPPDDRQRGRAGLTEERHHDLRFGTTARLTNSTVSGAGPTAVIAQNGVQISAGAMGHISNSVIRNHDYTPNSFFACGLLFFDAGVRADRGAISEVAQSSPAVAVSSLISPFVDVVRGRHENDVIRKRGAYAL